jgi:hypothetical protein
MDYDPMIEHSIKDIHIITEALQPLQQMFDEPKRNKQQLPITMFFRKVEKQTMSTIDNPQPSTSSAPDIIQPSTSSAASPASPFEVPGSLEADDPPSDDFSSESQ